MNFLQMNLENVMQNSTYRVLQRNGLRSGSSREYDTARWTFNSEPQEMSDLAFLPVIALIFLVLCSLLKAYQWSRESVRWKAQGDVEFSEDTEENYNVINVGDREFCQVDMPSDGASVYDTDSSFKLVENGCALQLKEGHPYHDTVTSYKSLLMQKADGSQYDSVKSYKAFLQKVTQNKDLAVEVKLLENYPIRSKSAEHCVVLEEESSERSGEITTKVLGSLPLNKYLHKNGKLLQADKKRPRRRRASGDAPSAMRKRSASNPTYRRVTNPASSLPSVRQTVSLSSDSDEDTQQSFRTDRKKLWAERKKISRSISGGKISKDANSTVLSNGHGNGGALNGHKRIRHFSADGTHCLKKAAASSNTNGSNFVHIEPDLKNTQKVRKHLTKTMTKPNKPDDIQADDSSSENPVSSNSSDSDVLSDTVISDSDDDTKRNTHLSNASDDQTLDNDVFFSLDSGAELVSSSEILQSSPMQPLSETKLQIARAKEEFFRNKVNTSLIPPAVMVSQSPAPYFDNRNSNILTETIHIASDIDQTSGHDIHSTSTDIRTNPNLQRTTELSQESLTETVYTRRKSLISTDSQYDTEELKINTLDCSTNEETEESKNTTSPSRVQRFHVTFVNNNIPSLNSE